MPAALTSQGTGSPELNPAKGRIIWAWIVDLVIAVAVSQVFLGLIGYLVPPETASAMIPSLLIGLIIAFAYIGFSTPLLGNSVGKALFGLKIVDYGGQSPRWTVRMLLAALWPINGFIFLSSKSGRHWGDAAGRTQVILLQPKRSFWLGLAGGVILVFVAFKIGGFGMKIAILNSKACKSARNYLQKENHDGWVSSFPTGFRIVNNQALFDFKVSGEYHRVILERVDTEWQVKNSRKILEPLKGTSISFGTKSESRE